MIKGLILKRSAFITLFFFVWFFLSTNFVYAKNDDVSSKVYKTNKENNMIERLGKKKKKKKFPALLVFAGIAVAAVVIILLAKKKDSTPTESSTDGNYDTETLEIAWVTIPGGAFQMGDNFNEGDLDERPTHWVELNPYSISQYEVTFDQYDTFCDDTGRSKPYDEGWGRENRPVINVSWVDAKAFCDWLSQKTGKNIHLPTEAQWEKAARGTERRRYPWGNGPPSCTIVNYNNCKGKTMPVGDYSSDSSPYNIRDMGGNVVEWCADWHSPTYYSVSPRYNPTGPSGGTYRVTRGGSWNYYSWEVRSARRGSVTPASRNNSLGFRICYSQ